MLENEVKTNLELFCTTIQSPERMVRQRALKEFLEHCRSEKLTIANAADVFEIIYLQLLRCYADKYEMIRCLACSIISEMLKKLPENDFYLGYIIPAMVRRVGQPEIIEESEELRLQVVEQLAEIIEKYRVDEKKGDRLLKSYDNIVDILLKTLRDPCPAVQKESCNIIKLLASATPSFHYRAEALVSSTLLILKHRHSANRIVAIEALGALSLNILANNDIVTKIIVDISPLLMDNVPYVRRACGRVGCLMLMELKDRYSLFHRILPLVLNCLSDETKEVQNEISEAWIKAGAQYYIENETELAKFKLIDQIPENYPEEYIRPTLPCRAIVQRSMKIVNLILNEMEEWKEDIRLHATKLLKLVVLHAEKKLSTLFMEVNPVLAKTCMDSDKHVSAEVCKVAELIGILLDYDTWIKTSIDDFKKFPNFGHLKCFKIMYVNSSDAKLRDLNIIGNLLLDNSVCHNLDPTYQAELLDFSDKLVADNIVAKSSRQNCEENDDETEKFLYIICLKVIAFSYDKENTNKDKGFQILSRMDKKICNLHDRYLNGVIASIEDVEAANSNNSECILLLCGIISACGFQQSYYSLLKATIKKALEHALPEGRIKIFSSISIAMLRWENTMVLPDDDQLLLLKEFVNDIVVPYLIWNVGKSAESVRTMATACLCSISQGTKTEIASTIVSHLIKYLVGLLEDNSIATRAHALKFLLKVGALEFESLKSLAFAIVTRLDDPSAEVREMGGKCLGKLRLYEASTDDEQSRWDDVLKQILPIMFLHLENPEIKLRAAVLDSLKQLSVLYGDQFSNAANDVAEGCPYKKDINSILAAIN